jgi:1-acyl-sn-glycerol-3-phosphate acyltransferase
LYFGGKFNSFQSIFNEVAISMDIPVEGWTFSHLWVRPVTKFWFHLYHRSVTYSGYEDINWQKPIIFAPSHRNAFTDALCIILPTKYTNDRFIYPLIRADAFGNSKTLDWILTRFHMFPVYRPRDKVDMVSKNELVFDRCYELLAQNRNLLIHPEGNCIPQNRVRSFKKGLARIAFGAEEKYGFSLNVNIIPVGITYREITEARQGIHVRFGDPVCPADFREEYQMNTAAAINKLTQTLHDKVAELSIDLPARNYRLGDDLLKLNKSLDGRLSKLKNYASKEFRMNQTIAGSLKKMNDEDEKQLQTLSGEMNSLKDFLHRNKLYLTLPLNDTSHVPELFLKGIAFLLLLPLAIYGGMNNVIPWLIMRRLINKVQETQFISSARHTLGLVLFPVCYILQTILVFFLTPRWIWAVIYLATLPISGLVTLNWWENLRIWWQKMRLAGLSLNQKRKINDLAEQILSKVF